jgi:hypothetical protein
MVHQFSGLTGLETELTRLEVTAVATVSLMLGVVLGGLVVAFSRHAARGMRWETLPIRAPFDGYPMESPIFSQAIPPDGDHHSSHPGKTRRGRHRVGRIPIGMQ